MPPAVSKVWKFFKKVGKFNQTNDDAVTCLLCDKVMKQAKGSTSNMMSHLRATHPKELFSSRNLSASSTSTTTTTADDDDNSVSQAGEVKQMQFVVINNNNTIMSYLLLYVLLSWQLINNV